MGLLEELALACPGAGAREARPGDAVDGVEARYVACPSSTGEVAAALSACARADSAVVARGSGTKLDWGPPPSAAEVVLDLSGLRGVVEHEPGDFVASVRAGTTLRDLARQLEVAGQRLPVDEVVPGSTVGGMVATGLSGPGRHLHGSVRDLLIGVTLVRADGVVARSGSKVVKNVAGYDLPKLLTGSYGTLAVVTEATFRLRPLARAHRFLTLPLPATARLARLVAAVLAAPLDLAAAELHRPAGSGDGNGGASLTLLLEGDPAALEARADAADALLGGSRQTAEPPPGWGCLPGPVTVKVTFALPRLAEVLELVAHLERELARPLSLVASTGVGVAYLGFEPPAGPQPLGRLLAKLRAVVAPEGGSAVLLRAPAELEQAVDGWGPVPGLELMRRVKERFDPERRLSPGRFVGGI